jgi:hypothetical protein
MEGKMRFGHAGRVTLNALIFAPLLILAPNAALADIISLNCGSGGVYVIDSTARTMTARSGSNAVNFTGVVINDDVFSGIQDNSSYQETVTIDRKIGTLTVTGYCKPGGCSAIGPWPAFQCSKILNNAF